MHLHNYDVIMTNLYTKALLSTYVYPFYYVLTYVRRSS